MRELAVPGHRDQPAGQLTFVDVPGEVLVDPVQPLLVESDFSRLDFDLQSTHLSLRSGYFALSKFNPILPIRTGLGLVCGPMVMVGALE